MPKISLLLCLVSFTISAQNSITKELDSVVNIDLANEYIAIKDSKYNKLITFNQDKHKTALAKDLFEMPYGRVKSTGNEYNKVYYKVVERNNIPHFRVSYILLDEKKLAKENINSLRHQIIYKYKNGVSFKSLAKYYSMDNNAKHSGDSGWFSRGEMSPEFEATAINGGYNVGDIFIIDNTEKGRYYVVLKTHESKDIKEIKVLKIVENRK